MIKNTNDPLALFLNEMSTLGYHFIVMHRIIFDHESLTPLESDFENMINAAKCLSTRVNELYKVWHKNINAETMKDEQIKERRGNQYTSNLKDEDKIELIKEFMGSSLNAGDFALSKNIGVSTFSHWRRKYKEQTGEISKRKLNSTKRTSEEIDALIKEQKESGYNIVDFCKMKDISAQIFYNRFMAERDKISKKNKSQLSFQRLEVDNDIEKKLESSEKINDLIQIDAGNGIKLTLPKSTDITQIINLVKGLKK